MQHHDIYDLGISKHLLNLLTCQIYMSDIEIIAV